MVEKAVGHVYYLDMKNEASKIIQMESVTEVHRALGLPGPVHPLISVMDSKAIQVSWPQLPESYILNLYKIKFITKSGGKFRYGQGYYDFDEGSMLFTAPHQLVGGITKYEDSEGCAILIHPDFLQGYPLAAKIKQYGFFSYDSNEALHLSEKEKEMILSVFNIIRNELDNRIDDFSHEVLIAQIELLLTYAKRFYKRQFCTRQAVTNDLLQQLENLLDTYFDQERAVSYGMPTVQYLAEQLNYSPNYLSDMLRSLTGLNAQQHIHQKLIEKAKYLLSATSMTINEVAYQLGFEYPQSFSRLFKMKTQISPLEYRKSFN